METPKVITNTIQISAHAERVWEVLTKPEYTKQYMFGCVPETDWQPNSPILWKGVFDGVEMTAVKGHIVQVRPGHHLSYTVIDPNNQEIPDVPENYLTVTYDLQELNGETRFTVTQGDYSKVANGEARFKDSEAEGGWQAILEQIKSVAEQV
ncbi:SRPBCC domain-containing protein [Chitinophaga horti]|uniref:SRPBCC domain-containing protein n=1 Tax=Chitinophaga horti TaxID=2920382 RepID=A0ABY6J8P7_9BACT|nr:SRPBCC domain-containing protein [Chitinophaga horti]UYQ94661.1 SRPBCC domain-containing protein [Chitinophaga horti]